MTEYPRWRLTRDRKTEETEELAPVEAEFELSDEDRAALAQELTAPLPSSARVVASRTYNNTLYVSVKVESAAVITDAATASSIHADDVADLAAADSLDSAVARARNRRRSTRRVIPREVRQSALFFTQIESRRFLVETNKLETETRDAIKRLLPKFFYFSNYSVLPGSPISPNSPEA